jgi:hypothetical protein
LCCFSQFPFDSFPVCRIRVYRLRLVGVLRSITLGSNLASWGRRRDFGGRPPGCLSWQCEPILPVLGLVSPWRASFSSLCFSIYCTVVVCDRKCCLHSGLFRALFALFGFSFRPSMLTGLESRPLLLFLETYCRCSVIFLLLIAFCLLPMYPFLSLLPLLSPIAGECISIVLGLRLLLLVLLRSHVVLLCLLSLFRPLSSDPLVSGLFSLFLNCSFLSYLHSLSWALSM